jgi:hypothetical protein
VGQAYLSELAARAATTSIAENPSIDLLKNLKTAERAVKQMSLPEPNSGFAMVDAALKDTREKEGSQTMLNQLSINSKTGEVSGLFLGDGGFSVLRADGSREHFNTLGKDKAKLSSTKGIKGIGRKVEDAVGGKITLAPGDSIMLYSDSMQHEIKGELLIDSVCDVFHSQSESTDEDIASLWKSKADVDPNDDDKSLLRYVQKA